MSGAPKSLRADHAGSLVRPAALEKARARFAAGAIPREDLEETENEAVRRAVQRQRDCGLPAATDGGFRAEAAAFFAGLTGVERVAARPDPDGGPAPPDRVLVTERLRFPADHPMLEGFRFLAGAAGATAKAILPSPGALHRSLGPDALHVAAYREEEALLADIGDLYAAALAAFHAAGCRILQFDDDAFHALAVEGGPDARRRAEAYAGTLRAALAAQPADMSVALHLAAKDDASARPADRDAFAELVFSESGAGTFLIDPAFVPDAALRFLPAGRRALLGLVDAGNPALERLDDIRRAVDAAGGGADASRFGIAARPGFADSAVAIGEDAQWRKLDLVVAAAERIWGETAG